MPTTRARHSVTETPDIAEALDHAARVWPELKSDRAALLRKLIEVGRSAVESRTTSAIRKASGAATGSYPASALADLRSEWPE